MAANREPPSPAAPKTDQHLREQRLLERARQILLRRIRQGTCLSNPTEVKDYLRLQVGHLEHEVFGCLFLDNQHAVIAAERRDLARRRVVVVVRVDALGTVDIRVLDHFVVGSAEALSFAERGLL